MPRSRPAYLSRSPRSILSAMKFNASTLTEPQKMGSYSDARYFGVSSSERPLTKETIWYRLAGGVKSRSLQESAGGYGPQQWRAARMMELRGETGVFRS